MTDQFFNKHYIRVNADGNIIAGFSNAFQQPQESDILINDQGGYQFRLFPDGEENPHLITHEGIALYRWTDGTVHQRTEDEMNAERNRVRQAVPTPTHEERIEALEAVIMEMVVAEKLKYKDKN